MAHGDINHRIPPVKMAQRAASVVLGFEVFGVVALWLLAAKWGATFSQFDNEVPAGGPWFNVSQALLLIAAVGVCCVLLVSALDLWLADELKPKWLGRVCLGVTIGAHASLGFASAIGGYIAWVAIFLTLTIALVLTASARLSRRLAKS